MALDDTIDIAPLAAADLAAKGTLFDLEAAELVSYAEDAARSITLASLKALGMGPSVAAMPYPPDLSLMRWIVQRLAIAYLRPPTRWLLSGSKRLSDGSSAHAVMIETLARSQYDGAWQSIDEMRALLRSAVVRIYPIDEVGRCELRIFGPHQVMRQPSDAMPSLLDLDEAFALRLSAKRMEYWTRDGSTWRCFWLDAKGRKLPIEDQPYGASGECPYDRLPVALIPDSHTSGRAWAPLRTHRLGSLKAISAISAELLEMIRMQGHGQRYFAGIMKNELPPERGMTVDLTFSNPAARGEVLNASPQIAASLDVLKTLIVQMLASEELPLDALSEGRTILTGAALKVSMAGLLERQERLAQVAAFAEPDLYDRFRSVHNLHAYAWNVDELSEHALEVELAPLTAPTTETETIEVVSRRMALGLSSRVDAMIAVDGCTRVEAIKRLDQVDADRKEYPAPIEPDTAEGGVRTSTAPDAVLDTPGATSASVADAIAKANDTEETNAA